ncbi:hypothetical protein PJM41_0018 [Salmonella phage vB_SenS_UTK0009]|uniref:Uncharacterized protein n=1 Tax=Salmonella phage vB_SenS_UTK0009 TaxID=3028908 RepID=A0AAE9ZJV3_9CAUD|nr:hypothetical protein PJM41_0018 [Salmonella phage vB_SenS_UTK0009]
MFTQQTIKVVADHELDTWDYSFKDLTATVQFKSMQLTFINDDELACKQFQGKLTEAKNIFGKARIPADNLINALLAGGYTLIKTEINRPSTTKIPRDPWISSALNGSDKRLMSDMHNVPCGGVVRNAVYLVGDGSPVKGTDSTETDAVRAALSGSGVSEGVVKIATKQQESARVSGENVRNVYTVNLSNPCKDDFVEAIMAALDDMDKRGR